MKNRSIVPILFILASFASVCAVLFTPALPQIARYLKISEIQASSTVTLFLIGYAFGNLPWGPLTYRFGKKKTVLIGMITTLVGIFITLLMPFFPSLFVLNLGRFITAVGSSVGFKMAFTYIGDFYKKEEAATKVAYLILSYAITPSLAIVLGGFLTTFFGWYSCFLAQGLFTFIVLSISLKLPKDPFFEKKQTLSFVHTLSDYAKELCNVPFLKSSFLMGCDTAVIYVFASLSPFIAMSEMGLSPKNFGLLNFIPPIGVIFGFFLTKTLEKKKLLFEQVHLGIKIASYFFIALFISLLIGIPRPLFIFIPMIGILSGLCLVYTNAAVLAMHTSHNKANGSAIANFLDVSFPSILLLLGKQIPYSFSKILLILFSMIALILMFLFFSLKRDKMIQKLLNDT